MDFYLQYAKDFNEKHHFDIMAGYSWQHFHRSTENAYNNLNGDNPTSYIFKTESYLISFFGRVNYSFMNRYLITATLRNDGTSRFSKDNRWGLFPSVALGWKIKEEGFMKDVDAVSDLKLRLFRGTRRSLLSIWRPICSYRPSRRLQPELEMGGDYYLERRIRLRILR